LALPLPRGDREAWGGPVYADRVLVNKAERRLELLRRGRPLRSYRIALGANPDGHKLSEGDKRTPEGRYVLDWRNPWSKFYKSIHISYPNEKDVENAEEAGVSPGGLIMIHGLPMETEWVGELHALKDWTDGCIAVTNAEMDEIWAMVKDGTPIEIR
jgi:murein L,D-transpeptidase YafK